MSPGPSLIVVSQNTLIGGLRTGILTSISHGIGVCFYALLTVFGMALFIQSSQMIVPPIRLFGCIFLLYLAWNTYNAEWNFNQESFRNNNVGSYLKAIRDGLTIAIINPKIIVFFIALFGQFIKDDTSVLMKLNLVLIATLVDIIWYILVALLLSRSKLSVLHGSEHFLRKGFSLILIIFSIYFFTDILLTI